MNHSAAQCCLTLALSGTQHAPRSGNLLLLIRDERPVRTQCFFLSIMR